MSDLDRVNGLLAAGDRDSAIAFLASILIKNKKDLDAWLYLGDLIDDPARKKDCYQRVLRLCPDHAIALAKLQELETPLSIELPVTGPEMEQTDQQNSLLDTKRHINPIPSFNLSPPVEQSNTGAGIIGYLIVGIAAFLLLLYVVAKPGNFSNSTKVLYLGLIFIGLIAGITILSVSNKHRS